MHFNPAGKPVEMPGKTTNAEQQPDLFFYI
jgi:hypothetical protein